MTRSGSMKFSPLQGEYFVLYQQPECVINPDSTYTPGHC